MSATVAETHYGDGFTHAWPPDRYEVLCERIAPFPESRDRYHFAKNAMEAARALERIGLARRVVVIRLTDNTVLYDPVANVNVPPEAW
ncbi:hypothetical protein TBS_11540 [Thermobispora bispora]|jgi:hypothetical protein|uniref:Uncharacterized protein n=1 Tax=Thermobispora bispora (strain ATCC 19993 / DSM 43833 / CBS 139.67 / JCM 10125 / KCTC 9307 / NBRC 14880 / R51) TaxID=469371 RepID=D6Y2K2_THEBD|nr:hypothetical protein [Thermobispora bispora]ADG88851.1 hypothetical protein Tbis_2140 [Thermobispora bispora DSM 43833]MBO2473435.1 hypothetical protein [Actinomycetales bacterium]QSI48610.1 hypothetical protein CYL17_12700 [Thermobispora bispora]